MNAHVKNSLIALGATVITMIGAAGLADPAALRSEAPQPEVTLVLAGPVASINLQDALAAYGSELTPDAAEPTDTPELERRTIDVELPKIRAARPFRSVLGMPYMAFRTLLPHRES